MPPDWYFDERRHAGEEHLVPERVNDYDEKVPFDPTDEVERLRELGLSGEDTVVDFGTGTGVFPLAIAPYCDRVIGVDISEAMIRIARRKAEEVANVSFVNDGFLRYDHEGPPASFAFSRNALHHLPDFWKVEALKNVGSTLEPGGLLRLRDLVYSFDPEASHPEIDAWLAGMEPTPFTEEELDAHFGSEFSTYDFVMEPILERTGFDIVDAAYREGFYAAYTCRWRGDSG